MIFDDFQWAPRDDDLGPARCVRRGHGVLGVSGEAREHEPGHHRVLLRPGVRAEAPARGHDLGTGEGKISQLAVQQWKMVDPESGFGKLFVNEGMVPFVPLLEAELQKFIHAAP